MSFKLVSDREDAFNDGRLATASTSLLRMAGGWGNINGPGLYMVRMLVSGSTTAVFLGMTGATLGAIAYGTAAIPFMVCSCGGFILGTVAFYRSTMIQAMITLDRYPRLMQLHLDAQFPWKGFLRWRQDQLTSAVFLRSWTLRSMGIVAWLCAQPALEQITDAREKMLIEEATQMNDNEAEVVGDPPKDPTSPDAFGSALRAVRS